MFNHKQGFYVSSSKSLGTLLKMGQKECKSHRRERSDVEGCLWNKALLLQA